MNKVSKNRQRQFTKALKGRTIQKVDARCINAIRFYLDNGKVVELETEYAGHGVYAIAKVKKPNDSND